MFTDEDCLGERFSSFGHFLEGLTFILSTMSLSKRKIKRNGLVGLLVKAAGQRALKAEFGF